MLFPPTYVREANGYYIGQVLPVDHVHAGCYVRSIQRTRDRGPLADRYMIDWSNDEEGTSGTFVSWR